MKRLLVCLILACVPLSRAQEFSSRAGDNVKVQHVVKFSGTLRDIDKRGSVGGTVDLDFMMYSEPHGGVPYWQETQNVRPDAHGRYTVNLGETTPGGLPENILAPGREPWLGVRISGEPEQSRILLANLPSTWEADSINPSFQTNESGIPPSSPTEQLLTLIVVIMFLAGIALACSEVVTWWKARMEQLQPPPLANLITYVRDSDRRWHATQVLGFPLTHLRANPGSLQPRIQSVEENRLKKAA